MPHSIADNLITTKEAGKLSGYTPDYLARLVRSGKLTGKKMGNIWLIERYSLNLLLNKKGDEKTLRVQELARVRTQEYRERSQPESRVSRMLVEKSPVPLYSLNDTRFRSHAVALSVALGVVIFGVISAQDGFTSRLASSGARVAHEIAYGFDVAFSGIPTHLVSKIADANTALREDAPRAALMAARDAAYTASPILADADIPLKQPILTEGYHPSNNALTIVRAPQRVVSSAPTRAASSAPFSIPALTVDTFAYAYSVPGQAVVDAAHAVIHADVALAYGMAALSHESARVTVALLGSAGDTLALATSYVPALATTAWARASAAPAELAPMFASAIFGAEYTAAHHFVTFLHTTSERYLAFVEGVGSFTYEGTEHALAFAAVGGSLTVPQMAAVFTAAKSFVAGETYVYK